MIALYLAHFKEKNREKETTHGTAQKFAEPEANDVVAALVYIRYAGVNIRIEEYNTVFINKDGELVIGPTVDLKTIRKFLSNPK